jgi:hypothetical protein
MSLGLDLARALDPVVFAEDCGVTPDRWQADLLRSSARRALLLCSRQSGKSTVTALLALWVACFEAGLVVIVSPSQRQSAEMLQPSRHFARLTDGPRSSPECIEAGVASRAGSALPGTERTIRGTAGAALIVIDEAARVDDELLQRSAHARDSKGWWPPDRIDHAGRQEGLFLRKLTGTPTGAVKVAASTARGFPRFWTKN